MEQMLAHLFGDYVLQSPWMADNKSKRSWPCLVHVFYYTLPFLLLTRSWKALLAIAVSHFVLDRFALARYLTWLKNHVSPDGFPKWSLCTITGYFHERTEADFTIKFTANLTQAGTLIMPPEEFVVKQQLLQDYNEACKITRPLPLFLAVMLAIIADNAFHLLCNYAALKWLG